MLSIISVRLLLVTIIAFETHLPLVCEVGVGLMMHDHQVLADVRQILQVIVSDLRQQSVRRRPRLNVTASGVRNVTSRINIEQKDVLNQEL